MILVAFSWVPKMKRRIEMMQVYTVHTVHKIQVVNQSVNPQAVNFFLLPRGPDGAGLTLR